MRAPVPVRQGDDLGDGRDAPLRAAGREPGSRRDTDLERRFGRGARRPATGRLPAPSVAVAPGRPRS